MTISEGSTEGRTGPRPRQKDKLFSALSEQAEDHKKIIRRAHEKRCMMLVPHAEGLQLDCSVQVYCQGNSSFPDYDSNQREQ